MLSAEIHDATSTISLLNMVDGERRYFGTLEPAAQGDRQDRAVPQALGGGDVWSVQELLGLSRGARPWTPRPSRA